MVWQVRGKGRDAASHKILEEVVVAELQRQLRESSKPDVVAAQSLEHVHATLGMKPLRNASFFAEPVC